MPAARLPEQRLQLDPCVLMSAASKDGFSDSAPVQAQEQVSYGSTSDMAIDDRLMRFGGSLAQAMGSMSLDEVRTSSLIDDPWSMAVGISWDEEEMEEFNGQMQSVDENSSEVPSSQVRAPQPYLRMNTGYPGHWLSHRTSEIYSFVFLRLRQRAAKVPCLLGSSNSCLPGGSADSCPYHWIVRGSVYGSNHRRDGLWACE